MSNRRGKTTQQESPRVHLQLKTPRTPPPFEERPRSAAEQHNNNRGRGGGYYPTGANRSGTGVATPQPQQHASAPPSLQHPQQPPRGGQPPVPTARAYQPPIFHGQNPFPQHPSMGYQYAVVPPAHMQPMQPYPTAMPWNYQTAPQMVQWPPGYPTSGGYPASGYPAQQYFYFQMQQPNLQQQQQPSQFVPMPQPAYPTQHQQQQQPPPSVGLPPQSQLQPQQATPPVYQTPPPTASLQPAPPRFVTVSQQPHYQVPSMQIASQTPLKAPQTSEKKILAIKDPKTHEVINLEQIEPESDGKVVPRPHVEAAATETVAQTVAESEEDAEKRARRLRVGEELKHLIETRAMGAGFFTPVKDLVPTPQDEQKPAEDVEVEAELFTKDQPGDSVREATESEVVREGDSTVEVDSTKNNLPEAMVTFAIQDDVESFLGEETAKEETDVDESMSGVEEQTPEPTTPLLETKSMPDMKHEEGEVHATLTESLSAVDLGASEKTETASENESEQDDGDLKSQDTNTDDEGEATALHRAGLESKRDLLKENNKEVDVENGRYGRDFMYVVRDLEQELGPSGPVTRSKLEDLKLTPSADQPVENRFRKSNVRSPIIGEPKRANQFDPEWIVVQRQKHAHTPVRFGSFRGHHGGSAGRIPDRVRSSATLPPRRVIPPPPIARPSIERPAASAQPSLHKAANAWRRDAPVEASSSEEEARRQLLVKEVRSLLNKIAPNNKEKLIQEFISHKVSSEEQQLHLVVGVIFDRAVEEPKFCPLYAELCKMQVLREGSNRSPFRTALLVRAQATFANRGELDEAQLAENIAQEEDAKKKRELQERLLEMKAKVRRRKHGNITLLGHLYMQDLLVRRIVDFCIMDLLKECSNDPSATEESVNCVARLLETLGKKYEAETKALAAAAEKNTEAAQEVLTVDKIFSHLEDLRLKVANPVKFKIMDLVDLRKNKWVPRKTAMQAPKSKEEVHREAELEKIQKELEHQQAVEKSRGGPSAPTRQPSQRLVIQRNPDIERSKAAQAARDVPTVAPAKNSKLSSLEIAPKPKNAWASGARGGGSITEQRPSR